LAIYKAGWDKLTANKNHKSFRQYILAQFNQRLSKSLIVSNQSILPKNKQANILKVPSSISPRPSKKVLEKSKFFKENQVLS